MHLPSAKYESKLLMVDFRGTEICVWSHFLFSATFVDVFGSLLFSNVNIISVSDK